MHGSIADNVQMFVFKLYKMDIKTEPNFKVDGIYEKPFTIEAF